MTGTPIRLLVPAAVWMIASAPALASGRLGGGEELGVSLGRIVGALLVCLLVAGLAVLVLRQRAGKGDLHLFAAALKARPRALDVVETRRLSQHADICLIRHAGREYLLLLMAGSARILSDSSVSAGESAAQ